MNVGPYKHRNDWPADRALFATCLNLPQGVSGTQKVGVFLFFFISRRE